MPDCPKRMQFGPCGGVRPDGSCEVRPHPCTFGEVVEWSGTRGVPRAGVRAPVVLADFTSEPYSLSMHSAVASVLAPSVDAALVGEHQNRPDHPPTLLAERLLGVGLRTWITLTCRDRNRIVLEQELAGLAEVGVDTVFCVTGDARGYDVRTDVTQVFDLDGPRLAALAAAAGLVAAVPETPTAPPTGRRPLRLLQKQHAGASVAVLNHAPLEAVTEFMARARALGLTIPVLAGVPVYTDARSAAVLDALPGLDLDHDTVRGVLESNDPVEAGIAMAVTTALRLLAVPGIEGVNLSGSASAAGPMQGARVKAEVGDRLRFALATRG